MLWTNEEGAPNSGSIEANFEIQRGEHVFNVRKSLPNNNEQTRADLVLEFDSPCLEARYVYEGCGVELPAGFDDLCAEEPETATEVLDTECEAL